MLGILFSLEVRGALWSHFGAGGAFRSFMQFSCENKTFGFWCPVIPGAFLSIKNDNSQNTLKF